SRIFYNYFKSGNFSFSTELSQAVLLIGDKKQILKALDILQFNEYKAKNIIPLSLREKDDSFYKGTIEDIGEVVHAYRPSELIFCDPEMRYNLMMKIMYQLGNKIRYRILTPEGDGLISSFSSSRSGELFSKQIVHRLSLPHIRAQKKVLDLLICITMVPVLPLLFLFVKKYYKLLADWFAVLWGKKTWVGYHPRGMISHLTSKIPPACIWEKPPEKAADPFLHKYNYNYSMDYRVGTDLEIFFNHFKRTYQ
nr:hypothetical protein [Saprospiraceae bacterium]